MNRVSVIAVIACGCLVASACGADRLPGEAAPGPGNSATSASTSPGPSDTPSQRAAAESAGSASSACTIPASLAGRDLERLPVRDKVVALTFDAGANGDAVWSIRKTLVDKGVKATFFLTGNFVRNYPFRARVLAVRDLVGNHTVTHPDLTTLSNTRIVNEVRTAENLIHTTTGEDPRRFFRFPYGARNSRVIGVVNSLCYVPFRWTVDTLGWKGTSGGQSVATVVARVLNALRPGAIVLMHVGSNPDDGSTLDADSLNRVINRVRAHGYRFVRLDRVMSAAP